MVGGVVAEGTGAMVDGDWATVVAVVEGDGATGVDGLVVVVALVVAVALVGVAEETATLASSTWRVDEEDRKWPAATGTTAVKAISPAIPEARIRPRATRRRGS